MHPKIKPRPVGVPPTVNSVQPPLVHDVRQQTASANAASRQRMVAHEPPSGPANHARHHTPPKSQS